MKTLHFNCILKSDVILNSKSVSEGPQKTLDFIPGNSFLGIVASEYSSLEERGLAFEIFHSGGVRFGDAHPVGCGSVRSLRIPSSMFYPKLKKVNDVCYIHHEYDREKDTLDNGRPQQLKQCRDGFYTFVDGNASVVKTNKNFAIKSAYDRNQLRAKDSQMYGYESLEAGTTMAFSVEIDDDSLEQTITDALVGIKKIGRSRTAQYGLAEIVKAEKYSEPLSRAKDGRVTVYADGRLIFLDENTGQPTFQPSAAQLGFSTGKVDWNKSQVRTFQYSQWNYTRKCFEADRCGIEKGSVFVLEGVTDCPSYSQYIGSYRNEGFGRVIYNPDFLEVNGDNGLAAYTFAELCSPDTKRNDVQIDMADPLMRYVDARSKVEDMESKVLEMVNDFVCVHGNKFRGDAFASQWGNIRSIAMANPTKSALKKALFEVVYVEEQKYVKGVLQPVMVEHRNGYLEHGIAKDKWKRGNRYGAFKKFFDDLDDDNAQIALVNLASEMAKHK